MNILSQFYCLETLLLLGQLYYRLNVIFKNTQFEMSKCTNNTFWIYYIFTTIVFVGGCVMYSNYITLSTMITAFAGVLVLLLTITLQCLFMNKVFNVYRVSDDAEDLIKIITKTSLLAMISTFNTILAFLGAAIEPTMQSIHLNFVIRLVLTADIFTNFVCIFLAYNDFSSDYDKVCAKCDSCWGKVWMRCFMGATMPELKTLQLVATVSSTNPNFKDKSRSTQLSVVNESKTEDNNECSDNNQTSSKSIGAVQSISANLELDTSKQAEVAEPEIITV